MVVVNSEVDVWDGDSREPVAPSKQIFESLIDLMPATASQAGVFDNAVVSETVFATYVTGPERSQ